MRSERKIEEDRGEEERTGRIEDVKPHKIPSRHMASHSIPPHPIPFHSIPFHHTTPHHTTTHDMTSYLRNCSRAGSISASMSASRSNLLPRLKKRDGGISQRAIM